MNMHLPSERMLVYRPAQYPFLESVTGPPLPYNSPLHLHEELEIALNLGRSWQLFCRGKTFRVHPGMVLLTPPEEPHRASSPEAGEGQYIGLRIHSDFIRKTLFEIRERPQSMLFFPELLIENTPFYSHILSLHHALQDGESSRLEQDELLQCFALHLLHFATDSLAFPTIGHEPGAIEAAKTYIQEHYQENVSLHYLAQQVHLSPFYFSRVFRAAVGLPPHAYLTQVRISRAKKFLASGVPPTDVAIRTGFHSQSHLNLHFKRLVGVTLGQYALDCGSSKK